MEGLYLIVRGLELQSRRRMGPFTCISSCASSCHSQLVSCHIHCFILIVSGCEISSAERKHDVELILVVCSLGSVQINCPTVPCCSHNGSYSCVILQVQFRFYRFKDLGPENPAPRKGNEWSMACLRARTKTWKCTEQPVFSAIICIHRQKQLPMAKQTRIGARMHVCGTCIYSEGVETWRTEHQAQ
jgi:hypothetical protein